MNKVFYKLILAVLLLSILLTGVGSKLEARYKSNLERRVEVLEEKVDRLEATVFTNFGPRLQFELNNPIQHRALRPKIERHKRLHGGDEIVYENGKAHVE